MSTPTSVSDLSTWSDSISLRIDYSVPILVTTKSGKKMARGYELQRFVLAHRIGVEDYETLCGRDPQKLMNLLCIERYEAKLQAKYGDWPVRFRGVSVMQHPAAETPKMDDLRWV